MAAVVFAVMLFFGLLKGSPAGAAIIALLIAGLPVASLFATGALLGGKPQARKLLVVAHCAATAVAAGAMGAVVYLLMK